MKRILIFALGLPLLSSAQSFEKGDFILGVGVDLGLYSTLGKDLKTLEEKTDGAVSSILPLGLEYGLTDHLGIGAQFRINSYFSDNDTASANNNDFSLLANYHFLRSNHFNMQLGLKYGISGFHYENNFNKGTFDATGGQFQLDLGANLFLGNHFGFQFHAAFNNLHYGKGTIEDSLGNKTDYSLLLNGANIGAGVLIKL